MKWWVVVLCAIIAIATGNNVISPWWYNVVYYRVVVDSFKDGDGDGLGDLKGKYLRAKSMRISFLSRKK